MIKRTVPENIAVKWEPGERLWNIKANPSNMEQVIINMVINARDAMPSGGRIKIRTGNLSINDSESSRLGVKHSRYVKLSVEDEGMGMDDET